MGKEKETLEIKEEREFNIIEYRRRLFEAEVVEFYNKWNLDDYKDDSEVEAYVKRVIYNRYRYFFREVKTLFPEDVDANDTSLAAAIYRLSAQQPEEYIIELEKEDTQEIQKETGSQGVKQENINPSTTTEEQKVEKPRVDNLSEWIQKHKALFEASQNKLPLLKDVGIDIELKCAIQEFEADFLAYCKTGEDWKNYIKFKSLREQGKFKIGRDLQDQNDLDKFEEMLNGEEKRLKDKIWKKHIEFFEKVEKFFPKGVNTNDTSLAAEIYRLKKGKFKEFEEKQKNRIRTKKKYKKSHRSLYDKKNRETMYRFEGKN